MPSEPDNQAPMTKWAGEPSASQGLGGSTSSPGGSDKPYDPGKKPSPFTEVGASGLAQYGGFVREEFLPALQGDNARKVYREMYDNDPIVSATVFAIQMLIRSVEWRVEPPEAATVEDIVQERFEERQQAVAERQQAQQMQLQQAQAGLAGNGQAGSPRGTGPGGKPAVPQPPQMGRSGLASGAGSPLALHQGTGVTPPDRPGTNPPVPATTPGTNAPATPNVEAGNALTAPGSNPGGGPAQEAALAGNFGTGTEPTDDARKPRANPSALTKQLRRMFGTERFAKSGSAGGGGGGVGGIDAGDVGMRPIDPETGEPMEFPVGAGLSDLTPEARKAEELAVFVETALHDMSDSWADTLSQIVTMTVFGFSYHEIIYKKRNGPNPDFPSQGSRYADGKVGWANFAGRAQETLFRWEFDDNGNILGFWQLAPPKFQLRYIPLSKALLFRTTAYKNNPEGRPVSVDTPLLTTTGWTTMGKVQIGESVFDDNGKPCRITNKSEVFFDRPTYEIEFSTGESVRADAVHLWSVTTFNDRFLGNAPRDLTTEQMFEWINRNPGKQGPVFSCGPAPILDFPHDDALPVDPYILGYWLGDGATTKAEISVHADDYESLRLHIEAAGYKVHHDGDVHAYISGGLRSDLRRAGVLGLKHIPAQYLRADEAQRLALLQGLMDSDGYYSSLVAKDRASVFANADERLIEEVSHLIRTLGGHPRINLSNEAGDVGGVIHGREVVATKPCYRVNFYLSLPCHRLERKRERQYVTSSSRTSHHFIRSIKPVESSDTVCIEVDNPSHLFLVGTSLVPTHNSIFRGAYRPWFMKKRIEEYEAIGVERDLAGIPLARVPYQLMADGATPAEQSTLEEVKTIVRNVRNNEQAGIVWPTAFDPDTNQPMWDFELLSGSGTARSFDTDKIITRYEQRIAMTALADVLLLGHDSVGARSLGETKVDLMTTALEAWLDGIADVVNVMAIPRLMQMNGEDPAMCPKLAHGKLATISLDQIASLITALSGAGADLFPDAVLEDSIREQGGLPPKASSQDL